MKPAIWGCLLLLASGAARAEWSVFDPLGDVLPPSVSDVEWSQPIDAFVFARLSQAGLSPSPEVDRRVWLRRVTFDLIGLPPSPTDVQEFLRDPRSDRQVMAEAVDRLLQMPQYGERWGRHWLDVVRYADSDGFAIDEERPTLWRYRDYVIRSLNEDRPFDQFIREQIAGDEIDAGELGKIAISFYRLGPYEADNMTRERRRQDYLNEVTSAVGSAFLGLTIGCARCHDHKFDPILQSDFYQLQAFFAPLERSTIPVSYLPGELNSDVQRRLDRTAGARQIAQQQYDKLRAEVRQQLADSRQVSVDAISDEQLDQAIQSKQPPVTVDVAKRLAELKKQLDDRKGEQRFEATVVAVNNPSSRDELPDTFVLNGGDVFDPGEKVLPGFPSALSECSPEVAARLADCASEPAGLRRVLAEWLTSPDNSVTARVLANRIWQYHFGVGIVATPNDMGINGSGASHPELLDYLARRLVADGWRLKPLHRELVLSRAYRSSVDHPDFDRCHQRDPSNRLLWRAHYRRLEAETIRDAVLAVSGRLNTEAGGPGFFERLPEGMGSSFPFFEWHPSSEDQRRRRSVYMFQRRNLVHPMMEAFDGPDVNQSCECRQASVTAPQALSLFNSQFVYENAAHLAQVLREYDVDNRQRVRRLFWLALSREPTDAEMAYCLQLLDERLAATSAGPDRRIGQLEALRDLCLAVFNTNEFVYLD